MCECSIAQLCPVLCDPMDCSLPGSSVHAILQARIWRGLPFLPLGDLPEPRIELVSPESPALASRFFTILKTSQLDEKDSFVFMYYSLIKLND